MKKIFEVRDLCATLFNNLVLPILSVYLFISPSLHAQGLSLTGVGAINRSFGGASVASPLDAAGSLHWNPAAISGLDSSQMELALELLAVDSTLSSSISALGVEGSTDSDVNASPIPNFAVVLKDDDSDLTYGFGLLSVAGFRVNYASSATNPILSPQPAGLGRLIGEAEIYQLVPTVAYQINEKLSIGFAPTFSVARLQADPFLFGAANADGTYGPGADSDHHFGGGFQLGVFYEVCPELKLGASVKSPQWFEDFRFNSQDESGLPREESVDIDYPLIASIGASYSGLDNLLLAMDIRYFNWSETDGFDKDSYDSTGALRGLGWDSTISVATGVQYDVSDTFNVRLGYNYGENPISNSATIYNVASPLIVEHIASIGLSFQLMDQVALSLAYLHGFENTVDGPIERPGLGVLPGTKVESEVSAQGFAGSLTIKF